MELTLRVPDDLAERLPPHEDQLVRILELGLRTLAIEEGDSQTDANDEIPDVWRAALSRIMSNRCQASDALPPTPEELIAYHRDELEPAEKEKQLDRLGLHPEAARDLLDLIRFDGPETSSADTVDRSDLTQALQSFRARVATLPETAPRIGKGDDPGPVETDPKAGLEPLEHRQPEATVHAFPVSPATQRATAPPSYSRRYRWAGWAAALLVAVGALWLPWLLSRQEQRSGPRYAAVIDVTTSRGARSFPVSDTVQEILLILPLTETAGVERGTLRIVAANGEVVYHDTLRVNGDPWSRLYLRLPRDRFRAGVYRIEISTLAPNTRPKIRKYRFAIEDPVAP